MTRLSDWFEQKISHNSFASSKSEDNGKRRTETTLRSRGIPTVENQCEFHRPLEEA